MKAMRLLKIAAVCSVVGLAPSVVSAAQSSILFILDSSGSMAGKVDGTRKMATAKRALTKLTSDLPRDVKVGLMVYGHRDKKSCTDVEVAIPVGPVNPQRLRAVLKKIAPKGKTPIAYALEQSSGAFADLKKGNNNIVLISDGIETCRGNPCKTAAALAKANVKLRIHVVGFDIAKKDRQQLECIAKVARGKYFAAKGAKDFVKAVTKAVQVAQAAPKPKPDPEPKAKTYFFDDFKGEVLGELWEVLKPNTDAYIVEKGELTIISDTKATNLIHNNVPNLMRLTKPLPRGDWRATLKFRPEFQTSYEVVLFGFYNDKKNWLMAGFRGYFDYWNWCHVTILATKVTKGKVTGFTKKIAGQACKGGNDSGLKKNLEIIKALQPILMRVTKKGRTYSVSVRFEGSKKPKWIVMRKLTLLRAKGGLAFGISMIKKAAGEGVLNVDWVKIETLK